LLYLYLPHDITKLPETTHDRCHNAPDCVDLPLVRRIYDVYDVWPPIAG